MQTPVQIDFQGLDISPAMREAIEKHVSRMHTDGVSYVDLQGEALRAEIGLAYRRHERSRAVQNFVTVARNEDRFTQSSNDREPSMRLITSQG